MSIPKHVAKSAEILWLDALEAEQEGDREAALELAKKVVLERCRLLEMEILYKL